MMTLVFLIFCSISISRQSIVFRFKNLIVRDTIILIYILLKISLSLNTLFFFAFRLPFIFIPFSHISPPVLLDMMYIMLLNIQYNVELYVLPFQSSMPSSSSKFEREWIEMVNNVTTCVLTFYTEMFLLNCHLYIIFLLQSTIKILAKMNKTCL